MRTVAAPLATFFLEQKHAHIVELYEILLLNGTVLRWNSGDRDLQLGTVTYVCGPGIRRERTTLAMGLETDAMRLYLYDHPSVIVSGMSLAMALTRGLFDQAQVTQYRAYAKTHLDPIVGTLLRYHGHVAAVRPDGFRTEVVVRSPLHRLAALWPRRVYGPRCDNMLFDGQCGLQRSAFVVTGTVSTVTGARGLSFTSTLSGANDHYRYGTCKFKTGANLGQSRAVMASAGGQLFFSEPWALTPAVGDQFEVHPGCDKRMATCQGKFNNLARFRGQPFIPAPETTR